MKVDLKQMKDANRLHATQNRFDMIAPDPLQFVSHHASRADREIAAFLAVALAHGCATRIQENVENLPANRGAGLTAAGCHGLIACQPRSSGNTERNGTS